MRAGIELAHDLRRERRHARAAAAAALAHLVQCASGHKETTYASQSF
jgi:hypothetical protein